MPSPKIKTGSRIRFVTAPIITEYMPIPAYPCELINEFMPVETIRNTVPRR